LIERYVAAVGRHLPAATRNDVQLELRTALQDALEERGLDADKKEDEAGVVALLKEYGRPEAMAVSYGTQSYLVGPLLFPHYLTVLRIVGTVITIVNLVGLALSVFQTGAPFDALGSTFGNYMGSLFTGFGIVTIVFAILERNAPEFKIEEDEDWDPRQLPGPVEETERADVPTIVAELFFLIAFIGLIRMTPAWVPADLPEPLTFFPIMLGKLVPFFGWFQLLWGAEFALKFAVLIRGRWNLATRIVETVLAFAGLAVAVLVTQAIAASLSGIDPLDQIIVVSLGITVVIILVDAFVKLYRLFRPPASRDSIRDLSKLSRLSKLSKLSELSKLSQISKRRGGDGEKRE
jgi:hypothetical protein